MAMLPWWIHYPNVNNEIINLDWILKVSNENTDKIENFIGVNTIKYADPILWDITSQYEANTIVVNPQTGDAYISTKVVPYGVSLSNEGYWTRIYNYAAEIHIFRDQIATDEQLSTTATAARSVGDLVFLNGLLYRVTAPMIAGDSYVEGSNCVKTTINEELIRIYSAIDDEASAREEADVALGGRIDNEASAREAADVALGGRIDAEALAREAADVALGGRIDAANEALGGRIDAEALAREAADVALGGRIDAEIRDREALSVRINNRTIKSVKDYGAIGDGNTDDSDAFIAALADTDTVFVPEGIYLISKPIIVGIGKSIIGESNEHSILKANNFVLQTYSVLEPSQQSIQLNAILSCVSPNWLNRGAQIENIKIEGDTNCWGILFYNQASGSTVKDCHVDNCAIGIYNERNGWGHTYDNCFITKSKNYSIYLSYAANGCSITNCKLYGEGITTNIHLFIASQCYGNEMSGGFIEGCNRGIFVNNDSQIDVNGVDFEVCAESFFWSYSDHDPNTGLPTLNNPPCVLSGCTFVGEISNSAIIADAGLITVEGCFFISPTSHNKPAIKVVGTISENNSIACINNMFRGYSAPYFGLSPAYIPYLQANSGIRVYDPTLGAVKTISVNNGQLVIT